MPRLTPPRGWCYRTSSAALLSCFLLTGGLVPAGAAEIVVPVFHQVAGEIRRIEVSAGDTLVSIGARVGVPWRVLATHNGLDNPNRIYRGQVLEADTRRIVPALVAEGLVVNVPEAAMYRFEDEALTARYTVGLGRPQSPTPLGAFTVLQKERNPAFPVPDTLLQELENEAAVANKKLSPDASFSLGELWIQLSAWGYGIHATPFTATLGQFLGYGSIRVTPGVARELYEWSEYGTRVDVVYHPVKLAVTPAGEIWVEAHTDIYGRGYPTLDEVLAVLKQEGVADRVDEDALGSVLWARSGVPQKIGDLPAANGTAAPAAASMPEAAAARWACLDCPPGDRRRVTFQLRANTALQLPNPYPLRILNDANLVVFRPRMVAQARVSMRAGEERNFVWEVRDSEGQPLPPGSYAAVIDFIPRDSGQERALSLPLWVGK